MTKQLLLLITLCAASIGVFAQDTCGERYLAEVFPAFTVSTEIYGSNVNVRGLPQELAVDIYEPVGDTISNRPLFLLAFGGSFTYGDRKSPDIVQLCEYFVKRGYVCASIDYRLGIEGTETNSITEKTAIEAVVRGFHDGRAALRFFHMNAEKYRLDTSNFIFGGVSAGGFISMHNAYLDSIEMDEYPEFSWDDMGGFEGQSGNPGFSTDFKICINLCGALGQHKWVEEGDMPLLSMHGDNDNTVPYGRDTIIVFGMVITEVSGSYAIDSFAQADNVIPSKLYTYKGADHVPFVPGLDPNADAYMDTTQRFIRDYLYNEGGICTKNTSIRERIAYDVQIVPNPSSDKIRIQGHTDVQAITVYNMKGQAIFHSDHAMEEIQIQNFAPGQYFVVLEGAKGRSLAKFVKE